MKIAFVSSLYAGWGGSEELWVRVAQIAISEGHTVAVSIYNWGELPIAVKELKQQGAIVYTRINDSYASQTFMGRLKLKIHKLLKKNAFGNIEKFNADKIIISQGGTYDFLWNHSIQLFLNRSLNKKIVLINQYNSEHNILSANDREIAKKIFSNCLAVCFVSNRNKVVSEHQLATKIKNAIVIKNPIKCDIAEISLLKEEDKLQFACVGRLDASIKGQDILLQALSMVLAVSNKWRLNIYGNGNDESYLRELVAYYKLTDHVFFKGFENNVANIWKVNEMLILPSLSEGTPLTLLEAMACNRSAIVTDVGGNGEYIINKENGLLVEAGSVSALSNAICYVLEHSYLLKNWQDACSQKIRMHYQTSAEANFYQLITQL